MYIKDEAVSKEKNYVYISCFITLMKLCIHAYPYIYTYLHIYTHIRKRACLTYTYSCTYKIISYN
jgi:hypothetical protein